MNQANQPKRIIFPLWAKIAIGIVLALVILSFILNPELRKTAGAILLLIGVVGFLWSGGYLIIDLFFTTHEKTTNSNLYKFLSPARKRYLLFFIVSIIIGWIGSALS